MMKFHFVARVLVALSTIAVSSQAADAGHGSGSQPKTYHGFILAAGNAESDAVRLAHLKELAHQCAVDGTTLAGLDTLIAFVERWDSHDARLDFFDREIRRTLSFDFGIDDQSPLHAIAAFYRARMLVWACLEYSDIYPFPEKRAAYLGKAREQFELAAKSFPENRVARMYLGQPMPPAKTLAVPAGAPAWAAAQREGLERLTDIIE